MNLSLQRFLTGTPQITMINKNSLTNEELMIQETEDQSPQNDFQHQFICQPFVTPKTLMPINKQYDKKNFTVGFLTHKTEYTIDQETEFRSFKRRLKMKRKRAYNEEMSLDLRPPKIFLIGFTSPNPFDYEARKKKKNICYYYDNTQDYNKDITNYIKQNCKGAIVKKMRTFEKNCVLYTDLTEHYDKILEKFLTSKEKEYQRKLWLRKFLDWQSRIPACCDKIKRFWKWVFIMNPDSKFKWSFKSMSSVWLDYMLMFLEFREPLRIWVETFELEILKEYKEDKDFHRKTASFIQYIRDIIRSKNNQLFDQVILKGIEFENQAPPEVAAHINNDGIMIEPTFMDYPCPKCLRDEKEDLLGNPKIFPKLKIAKPKIDFKKYKTIFQIK